MKAATATIGIRGTDFSTRLCNKDCAEESGASSQAKAPVVNSVPTVGRAMLVRGEVTATDSAGKLRKLAIGSPVYEGDLLVSAAQANAVVAFRDESRVSLQENTTFQVETSCGTRRCRYEAAQRRSEGGHRPDWTHQP